MFKKVCGIVGSLFVGINFGFLGGFVPLYLIIDMVLFPDDPLAGRVLGIQSILTALIAGILIYIYSYRKKREHETANLFLSVTVWSFAVAAAVAGVFLLCVGFGE